MNKLEEIRKHIGKIKASKFPIKSHALESADAYEKNLYFKMLCVFVNDCENVSADKIAYLNRLIAGTGAELTLPEYMKLSFDATTDDYDELINNVFSSKSSSNENDADDDDYDDDDYDDDDDDPNNANYLKYFFALDFLVLSYLGDVSDEQLKLAAEVFESLGIEINEFKFLAEICRRLLQNEDSANNNELMKLVYKVDSELVDCSFDKIVAYNFISYNNLKDAKGKVTVFAETISNAGGIDFNSYNFDEVLFYNCTFTGKMTFEGDNKNLHFKHCKYKNCTAANTYILDLYENSSVTNCSFINCYSSDTLIYLQHSAVINNCNFTGCKAGYGIEIEQDARQSNNSASSCSFEDSFID